MSYLLLAYPQLAKQDVELIDSYRKVNDELFYNVVDPHFTLVFPVFDTLLEDFVAEVKSKIEGLTKFGFTMRCATINKDAFSDYFHAFIVPDEGFSNIVKMHDRFYSGKLINNLRLDIDFIPHIGIGNSKDKWLCKKMVDEWNEKEFAISGTIARLTIVKYEDGVVTTIEDIELQ